MPKYTVKHTKILDAFFKIFKGEIFHPHLNRTIHRDALVCNDVAAALVYNTDTKKFILVRQFRYPITLGTLKEEEIIECVAGGIKKDDDPRRTARSEIREEIGYDTNYLEFIDWYYSSPGLMTERVFLFYAEVSNSSKIGNSNIGGLQESEDEYTEILEFSLEEMKSMGLKTATLSVAFQWFLLNKVK